MLLNTQKKNSAKAFSRLFLFVFILSGSIGCNTRIEGCLDLNADNFNLDAEIACKDCCTYPKIYLSLTQKWLDENFSNEDTLYDIHDQPYKIQDLKYFLSSWAWTDGNDEIYTVDSINAACNASTLTYTPDIITADTRLFSYTIGTIRQAPLTDSLYLTFGLVEDFSCLDPNDESTPVNLTDQSPLWNKETGTLETLRLVLQRDLNTVTFDTIFLTTKTEFWLPYELELRNGFKDTFDLSVNYESWFQDADNADLSSFGTSILNNLSGSITPTN